MLTSAMINQRFQRLTLRMAAVFEAELRDLPFGEQLVIVREFLKGALEQTEKQLEGYDVRWERPR